MFARVKLVQLGKAVIRRDQVRVELSGVGDRRCERAELGSARVKVATCVRLCGVSLEKVVVAFQSGTKRKKNV